MTETEQLEHAFTGQLRCQAILASINRRCPRAATEHLHVRCTTPGCHDEHMFLCIHCAVLLGDGATSCITCGQPARITP